VGSRQAEHLSLRSQQRIAATVEESVLKTEMTRLESQEEDDPNRILFFKPMSWVGQIRTHRRDESWSASLWQTFFYTSMGAQIPVIVEKPLAVCGCRKFGIDTLDDHLCTCVVHSGAKKTHDWVVDQLADLFRTTHKVKSQHVVKSRGQHCGDIELAGYLANVTDPVPLVLDLRIDHDRFGSSSDPNLNGKLHWPNDIDKSLNEANTDKIRIYRADYNHNPPTAAFMTGNYSWKEGHYFVTSPNIHQENYLPQATWIKTFLEGVADKSTGLPLFSELAWFVYEASGVMCSASACEHYWSIEGWNHSQRRNRLDQKLVEKLVHTPGAEGEFG
jgi:hypothetical protein